MESIRRQSLASPPLSLACLLSNTDEIERLLPLIESSKAGLLKLERSIIFHHHRLDEFVAGLKERHATVPDRSYLRDILLDGLQMEEDLVNTARHRTIEVSRRLEGIRLRRYGEIGPGPLVTRFDELTGQAGGRGEPAEGSGPHTLFGTSFLDAGCATAETPDYDSLFPELRARGPSATEWDNLGPLMGSPPPAMERAATPGLNSEDTFQQPGLDLPVDTDTPMLDVPAVESSQVPHVSSDTFLFPSASNPAWPWSSTVPPPSITRGQTTSVEHQLPNPQLADVTPDLCNVWKILTNELEQEFNPRQSHPLCDPAVLHLNVKRAVNCLRMARNILDPLKEASRQFMLLILREVEHRLSALEKKPGYEIRATVTRRYAGILLSAAPAISASFIQRIDYGIVTFHDFKAILADVEGQCEHLRQATQSPARIEHARLLSSFVSRWVDLIDRNLDALPAEHEGVSSEAAAAAKKLLADFRSLGPLLQGMIFQVSTP